MAEAVVENNSQLFFCHECNRNVLISTQLQEYVCPHCQGGFVEKLEEPPSDTDVDFLDVEHPFEIFSHLLGGNITNLENDTDAASDGGPSRNTRSRTRREQTTRPPRPRRPVRPDRPLEAITPLETLLQNVLGGMAGGAVFTSGGGVPVFFNLHGDARDYVWGQGSLDSIITRLLNQLDGVGPPPAPEDAIENLPTTTITKEEVDKVLQCSVCMEDFQLDEKVRQMPCLHNFHTDCIVPWLKLHGTCPICRKSLVPEQEGAQGPEYGFDVTLGNNSTQQRPSTSENNSNAPSSSSFFDIFEDLE